MSGLVSHLMSKHRLTHQQALARAKLIDANRKEQAAKKKARLERAQLTLGLDSAGVAGEEPADRFVVTDETVNF